MVGVKFSDVFLGSLGFVLAGSNQVSFVGPSDHVPERSSSDPAPSVDIGDGSTTRGESDPAPVARQTKHTSCSPLICT